MRIPDLLRPLAFVAVLALHAQAPHAAEEKPATEKPAERKRPVVKLPAGQVMTVKYFETLQTAEEYGSETDEAEAERFRDFSDALRHAFLVSGLLVELHIVHGQEETPPTKPVLQVVITSWGVDEQGGDRCRFNVAYKRGEEKVDLGEFVGRQANDDSPSGVVPADHFHAAVLSAARELVKQFKVE